MPVKAPKAAKVARLCSGRDIQHHNHTHQNPNSPSILSRSQSRLSPPPKSNGPQWRQQRSFATVLHGNDPHNHTPKQERKKPAKPRLLWPTTQKPTPYDIFNLARGDRYNKARFFELVMLYHPDRRHHEDAVRYLSKATLLERYRLVVAANEILCNPTKRRAYDVYGLGWGEPVNSREHMRRAEKAYREDPRSAANNATWEDWERWHKQQAGEQQEPLFISNGGFVAVMMFFGMLGTWGQMTRAGRQSVTMVEMRDQRSQHISEEMRKRESETALLDRDERVEHFLRQREGWGYSTAPPATPPPQHHPRPQH